MCSSDLAPVAALHNQASIVELREVKAHRAGWDAQCLRQSARGEPAGTGLNQLSKCCEAVFLRQSTKRADDSIRGHAVSFQFNIC